MRLFKKRHTHYWVDLGVPHELVMSNGLWLFECSVCDKQKYYKHQPMNPLVPSAWAVYEAEVARGNAAYVMSPPSIIRKESQHQEGERYAQLEATNTQGRK